MYVNRHYAINRKIVYDREPIQQKWNGIAQHIAAVVLNQTDIVVLTIFRPITDVSIYSVYNLCCIWSEAAFYVNDKMGHKRCLANCGQNRRKRNYIAFLHG